MAARRMAILVVLLCICLLPQYAGAVSTADAREPMDRDRECAVTICYGYEETVFSGQSVSLYRVAEVSEEGQYVLTEDFASSGLVVNGVQTHGEWDQIRSTLEVRILTHRILPVAVAETDDLGQACFAGLKPGLYLASAITVMQEDMTCSFDSALIALPGVGTDGQWQYSVTVAAKPVLWVQPDEIISFKVLKLWKGDEGKTDRPESIEVEIFRDGVSMETVILSEENFWSYSWEAKADGANWKVAEKNVPSQYTMTLEERENTFVVTNTRILDGSEPEELPPKTGDTEPILLYVLLMYVSGTMLILLGIGGKRKRHERT